MSRPLVKVKEYLDPLDHRSLISMTLTERPKEGEGTQIKMSNFLLEAAMFKDLIASFIPSTNIY